MVELVEYRTQIADDVVDGGGDVVDGGGDVVDGGGDVVDGGDDTQPVGLKYVRHVRRTF